jgi:hypothetical protein
VAPKRTGRIIQHVFGEVGQIGNRTKDQLRGRQGRCHYQPGPTPKIRLVVSLSVRLPSIATDMTAELDEAYLAKVTEGIPLKRLEET